MPRRSHRPKRRRRYQRSSRCVATAASSLHLEREIAPLLREHCLKCHSGKSPKGDLDLSSAQGLSAGGANGNAVEPGKSILAVKHLTRAEEYLADHFPTFPVMPGVLQ